MGQSGPGSNDNEEVLNIPQRPRTRASLLDGLVSCPGHSLERRDAINIFYSLRQLSCIALVLLSLTLFFHQENTVKITKNGNLKVPYLGNMKYE